MSGLVVALLSLVSSARAGDGPWTLNPGELNLYLGGDYFRYGRFHDGQGEVTDLGSPLTAASLTGVASLGLLPGMEVELVVPFESVRANDPESEFCVDGPRTDWCEATAGIGDVGAQIKGRMLDELVGSPISVSLAAGMRSGEAYSPRRGRLTTLGDGQTDIGAGLSAGRSAGVASRGWYRASVTSWYWYRFPNDVEVDGKKPGDEISAAAELTLSPGPPWAVGPAVYGFFRPRGVDVADADFSQLDGFSSLRASQLKIGAKLGIFGVRGRTVSVSVLRTVYARNNPSDTLALSLGIGWFSKPDLSRALR